MMRKAADNSKDQPFGLAYWMNRVLAEVDSVRGDLDPDRIHNLRVALRRCRSMAEGFIPIDPDKRWRAQLKTGRELFKQLGKLRDVHVQTEWVNRLCVLEDPVARGMLLYLSLTETELKRTAARALKTFNSEKWRGWIEELPEKEHRLPAGGAVFLLSALQAWSEAYDLHRLALRNRSDAAYHRLRIGIKKFRYIIENFLPSLHRELGPGLKEIQDCLGEMHDLSVLWQTALQLRIFPDVESRERWRFLIAAEKVKRIDRYRARMVGDSSLWSIWRQSLPLQSRLQSLALAAVEKWASFREIDLSRARNIKRLALQLLAGLRGKRRTGDRKERGILHLASILQELGRGAISGHLDLPSMPGLGEESLSAAIRIVRGLRYKLDEFSEFEGDYRDLAMELCGILRLARALSRGSQEQIRSVAVQHSEDSVIILASGYSELSPMAEKVSRARYLLEHIYQKPIMMRSVPASNHHGDSP